MRSSLDHRREALYLFFPLTLQCLSEERRRAIVADSDGFIIAEGVLAKDEHGYVQLALRRLFGRAIKLEARRILLTHNHPSGCANPSAADIAQILVLCRQAHMLGIATDDHLIVGARTVVSIKDRGLL